MITLVDSKGLVADNRGDNLPQHKRYFSKASSSTPRLTNLQEVVEHIKPTALLGLSTVKAAFTEDILRYMAKTNERPIIFALSNPLTQAECTFEEAIQWTDGKALFASGSPFADVTWHGKTLINNQGNNVYIFPGLGLGAILAKCATIPEDLIHTSANALAQATTEEEKAQFMMYPRLERIREVSGTSKHALFLLALAIKHAHLLMFVINFVTVAFKVIKKCQELGIARNDKIKGMSDKQLHAYIHQNMYDPLSASSGDSKL